jgi:hypothetical protein
VEGIILNFIDLHKINLIAMHVHHRNFFDKLFEISLSKKLVTSMYQFWRFMNKINSDSNTQKTLKIY